MAIELNDGSSYVAYPVIKHQEIGQHCSLAVIKFQQRDCLRRDQTSNQLVKIPNGKYDAQNNPKYKQELVIHAIYVDGTMSAGIGDQSSVPAAGERVRLILKSRSFGDWIEAKKNHRGGKFNVGDVLNVATTHAQQYDQNGSPKGEKIETQEQANKVPRNVTIGFYGSLELVKAEDHPFSAQFVPQAEAAYMADAAAEQQRKAIPLQPTAEETEEGWG